MIYIVLWLLLLIFSILHKERIWAKTFISALALILVFALRSDNVGIDTTNYHRIFEGIIYNSTDYDYIERGWFYLNLFVGAYLKLDFSFLLFIVALLIIIPIVYVAKKATWNPFLVLFLFHSLSFYTTGFNIMRQTLAMSFVLLFYYFIIEKRYINAWLFLIIACFFHVSSIFAVVIFLPNYLNRNVAILYLIITIFIGLMLPYILPYISKYFFLYKSYLADGGTLYRENLLQSFFFTILLNVFALFLILNVSINTIQNKWFNLYIYSLCVINVLYSIHYGARIYNVIAISQIIFFTNVIHENRRNQSIVLVCYVFFIVIFLKFMITNANGIMPYEVISNN